MSTRQALANPRQQEIARFIWIDRFNEPHNVGQMETRHLFYTVRMIWNHSAPVALRLFPYKRYTFGARYTGSYMRDAVAAMVTELNRRHPIPVEYEQDLRVMCENLRAWKANLYVIKELTK